MKRFFSVTSLVLVVSLSTMAQDYPKAEVFGGYSFLHSDDSLSFRAPGATLHGWNASITANLNRWFGLTADFSGHYDSSSSNAVITTPGFPGFPVPSPLPTFTTSVRSDTNIHTFMAGPRFSYRKSERVTPFAHLLFGVTRRHAETEISSSLFGRTSFSDNESGFAGAVGGGLDVSLGGNLALRVIQADYQLTHVFGNNSNNARISTGIVFRFGQ